jgi:hypothetical protein
MTIDREDGVRFPLWVMNGFLLHSTGSGPTQVPIRPGYGTLSMAVKQQEPETDL